MKNIYSLTSPVRSNPELEHVLRKQGSLLTFPSKKLIIEAETDTKGVYYIISGRTRHYMLGANGSEKILFVLTAGWFFGDNAAILDVPQHFYVMTEDVTELLFIPLENFRALLHKSPAFNEAILLSQAYKSMMMCREIESQVFFSSRERLLQLFYFSTDASIAHDEKWYALSHNYTQQELGTILGVSRVSISKFVNEFCNAGIIRIVNRRMQMSIHHYNRLSRQFAAR